MNILRPLRSVLFAALFAAPTLALSHGTAPAASIAAAEASSEPYAWCWASRYVNGSKTLTFYFSRVWSMGTDGPTLGFHSQFARFVNARYSSDTGRGGESGYCSRNFGRQNTETDLNELAARARRDGNGVVFTDWWPRG